MHVLTALYVIIVVLVLFGATIFVHELGHFLLARRHKLRIERFSIGFGPKIWGFTRDGVMGTLEFLSPEQARGEAADPRADLYQLAGSIYWSRRPPRKLRW